MGLTSNRTSLKEITNRKSRNRLFKNRPKSYNSPNKKYKLYLYNQLKNLQKNLQKKEVDQR